MDVRERPEAESNTEVKWRHGNSEECRQKTRFEDSTEQLRHLIARLSEVGFGFGLPELR